MADKQLTAKVRLNTTQAEHKLKSFAKAIDNLNRAVGRQTNAYGAVNKALNRNNLQVRKTTSATYKWNSATQKVGTSVNKVHQASNKVLRSMNDVNVATGKANKSAFNLSNGYNKANTSAKRLLRTVKNIASTYIATKGAMSITGASDIITSSENRLNNIEGGNANLTAKSMDKMYAAAQRSRSAYSDMLSNVSKSMALASDSFQGNIDNAIRFQEIMSKAYTIGGASATEQSTSMYQLIQALGSGILQGDELRSVREGAPIAYKEIEKFAQGVFNTEESLKDLASQGVITSDIIVAAIMNSEDKINKSFENTEMTFAQAWDSIKNTALKAFEPVLQKFNDFLNSDKGQAFIIAIGNAMVWLADVTLWVMDIFAGFFNWCAENWDWLKTVVIFAIIAITIYLTYMALKAIISFAIVHWQILLVVAVVILLIYILYQLGLSTEEIVGGICGAVMFLGYLIWDVIVWVITGIYWAVAMIWDIIVGLGMIIADVAVGIGTALILIIEGVVQIILWIVTTVWGILVTIYDAIYTVLKTIYSIFKILIVGIYQLFVWLGQGVLSIVWAIAKAIDFVFGSNLASGVKGWMDGLDSSVDTLANKLDPMGDFEDIGDQWKNSYSNLGDMYAGNGKYDGWNITDNMGDVVNGAGEIFGNIHSFGETIMLDPSMLDQWALDNTLNPMDGWNKGYEFGYNLGGKMESVLDGVGNFLNNPTISGLPNPNDPAYALGDVYDPSGANDDILKGLDELNGTTKDIDDKMDLTDDDLEYLRKIAEMEWRKEFTTAEIKIDMTNNNTVNGDRDLDGIVDHLAEVLRSEMTVVANGVHY